LEISYNNLSTGINGAESGGLEWLAQKIQEGPVIVVKPLAKSNKKS